MALALVCLNRLIRLKLAAPRIRESGTPTQLGLPWRKITFETANCKQLGAWLIPSQPRAPALVVLHGWGGNAEMMLPLAAPLHQAGYTLLLVDARNHGMSDGDTFSSLPRFAEDLEHAIDWLKGDSGIEPQSIGLIGHSVGAGAALLTASRRIDVAAVVSLAAFAHPESMMRRWLADKGIPFWPLGWYILKYVQYAIGWRFDDIAPCRTITQIACPVLIVHGSQDITVPVADAHRIYAARTHEQVRMLVVAGSHDEYPDIDPSLGNIVEFLNVTLKGAPGRLHRTSFR